MLYNISFTDLRRKAYQYHKNFKQYEGMEIADFEAIKASVSSLSDLSALDRYSVMLNRIPRDHFHTYDEKMASLISACDPDFYTLNIYNELGRPEKGTSEYGEYESRVRSQIGIFDVNLKYYEAYYVRRLNQIEQRNKLAEEMAKKLSK